MGLEFGVNKKVDVADHASLDLSIFSLHLWVYITNTSHHNYIAYKGVINDTNYGFGQMNDISYDRIVRFGFTSGGNYVENETYIDSVSNLSSNVWHSLTGTFDGSYMRLYIDGVLEKTGDLTVLAPDINNEVLGLGYRDGPASFFCDGQIFDIRVYNRVLSYAEAKIFHAARGADNIVNGLVGRWLMNERPDGTIATSSYTSQYPTQDTDHVKATTYYDINRAPWLATDPTTSLIGGTSGNLWQTTLYVLTNQRFHIDLGETKIIKRIYYENFHSTGASTNAGAENFTFWGSNTAGDFADLVYVNDGTWVQLTTSQATFDQHVAANQADPKYITVTNSIAYRYYAFKFADNYGNSYVMGVRRIELQIPQDTIYQIDVSGQSNHGEPYGSPTYRSVPLKLIKA